MKRELRSLTVADKEKFLDAAAAIWNYRDAPGKALFGNKFTSVDTLVAVHSMASNDIMCDGFHEGEKCHHRIMEYPKAHILLSLFVFILR